MKCTSLEQSLSTLQQEHPDVAQHIAGEASAREELARVSNDLARYHSIYGEAADASALSQQLEAKDAELRKLLLLAEQQTQAESSLFAEVDRLSSSWEILEQQVKKKVFDLSGFEDKLQRALHEVCVQAINLISSSQYRHRKQRQRISTSRPCARRKWVIRKGRPWCASSRSKERQWNARWRWRST